MTAFLTFLLFSISPGPNDGHSSLEVYAFSPLNNFDNGYPEGKYNSVIQSFKDVYGPIIEAQGGELKILDDWSDGAVNMWAFRWGQEYWLEIPGGMSRYHLINEEAFILSICHELGHLLGGPPMNGEISFEGQSDDYATRHCMEIILPHIEAYKDLESSAEVDQACLEKKHKKLCKRVLLGSLSLSSYYAELEGAPPPQLSTPSSEKVQKTLQAHPPAQCRLDSFYAGYEKRARPPCWFADH